MLLLLQFTLLLLVPSVPARKNHRKHIQESYPSQSADYRDYEALNSEYAQNYEYEYEYHQQDQQDHQHVPQHDNQQLPQRNKLLVIVLDG